MAIVYFYADNGILQGKLTQEVSDYSELTIPTPISNIYLQFKEWNKDIPESGEVTEDESFIALFEEAPIPFILEVGNEVIDIFNFIGEAFEIQMSKADAEDKFKNVTSYICNDVEYINMRFATVGESNIEGCVRVYFIQLTDSEVEIERLDETIDNTMEALFDGVKYIADPDNPFPLKFPIYVRANMFYKLDEVRYVCIKTDIVDKLDEEHFVLWDI